LNPDELVWSHMKRAGTAKRPLATNELLQDRIEADLTEIGSSSAQAPWTPVNSDSFGLSHDAESPFGSRGDQGRPPGCPVFFIYSPVRNIGYIRRLEEGSH
jgi:hypothetical protein